MTALKKISPQISDWGAKIFGLAVDTPQESAKMREELQLPFEILCDTERKALESWNILNKWERGGIAFPNLYIINKDQEIIYHSADSLASRVDLKSVIEFMETHSKDTSHRLLNKNRKFILGSLKDMFLGLPRRWKWVK